jgi:hypothetical protein
MGWDSEGVEQEQALLLLIVFRSGCSASTRAVVRLNTSQGGPLIHTPRRDVKPEEVGEEEFKKAVAQHAPSVPSVKRPLEYAGRLFGVPERSGWLWYEGRSQRLMASEPGSYRNLRLLTEDEELKRQYLQGRARPGGAPPGSDGHGCRWADHVRHFARAARAGE